MSPMRSCAFGRSGPKAIVRTPSVLDPATAPRLHICEASCSRHRSMPDTDLLAVAQAPEVLTRADRSHGRQAVPLASDRRVEHVEAHRRAADEELPAA
jgi:hypothetical protein